MSHLGTRLLADRFADSDEGVNSIVQELATVLYGSDALPADEVTVYDDTRHLWVAQDIAPDDDPEIEYPLIRLVTMNVQYESGIPAVHSSGARTVNGEISVMVQLLLKDPNDSVLGDGMYWLRAMRGVVVRLDDPTNEAARTFGGIQLRPATSIAQGKPEPPKGSTLVSPGALLLTYPFIETVPLPLSLH